MASRFTELVIDCANPARVAEFWAAVLGYRVLQQSEQGVEIGAPDGTDADAGAGADSVARPTLTFVPVPEAKTIKNRLHIDLNPTGQDQAAELDRLLALGARRVDVGQGPDVTWVVLADPEDNEFCLLRRRLDQAIPQ